MLIFDVSINRIRYIDSIGVLRIEGGTKGLNKYRVVKPDGPWSNDIIEHVYEDGYFNLMVKAVNLLDKYNYGEENKKELERTEERRAYEAYLFQERDSGN